MVECIQEKLSMKYNSINGEITDGGVYYIILIVHIK